MVRLRRAGRRPDQFTSRMKVTFCAGDEAAPGPLSEAAPACGAWLAVLLADAAAEVGNVDQFFQKADESSEHMKSYILAEDLRNSSGGSCNIMRLDPWA